MGSNSCVFSANKILLSQYKLVFQDALTKNASHTGLKTEYLFYLNFMLVLKVLKLSIKGWL